MRKFAFLGVLFILFWGITSCQEDYEIIEPLVEGQPMTRSSPLVTIIPSGKGMNIYPIIDDLIDMPLHIYLPDGANLSYNYLAGKGTDKLELAQKDESNYYPRWLIKKEGSSSFYTIHNEALQKVLTSYSSTYTTPAPTRERAYLSNYLPPGQRPSFCDVEMRIIEDGDHRYFVKVRTGGYNLASVSSNSREVEFTKNPYVGYYEKWHITPLEEFDILDIEFDYIEGQDSYTIKGEEFRRTRMWNPSSLETADYDYSYTISNSLASKFGKTEAEKSSFTLSMGIQGGVNVKTPWIDIGTTVTINTTQTQEWTQQLVFEETTTTSSSETFAAKYRLPPGTELIVWVERVELEVNLTFIATIKGRTTGKIIKTKGQWTGIAQSNIDIRAEDMSGNRIDISQYAVDPNEEPKPELPVNNITVEKGEPSIINVKIVDPQTGLNFVNFVQVPTKIKLDYPVESDVVITLNDGTTFEIGEGGTESNFKYLRLWSVDNLWNDPYARFYISDCSAPELNINFEDNQYLYSKLYIPELNVDAEWGLQPNEISRNATQETYWRILNLGKYVII